MSWSTQKIGLAAAVAVAVEQDLSRQKCQEPEESIKNNVAVAIRIALGAFPKDSVVDVKASGSQSKPDYSKPEAMNNLSVSITPIYSFVSEAPAEPVAVQKPAPAAVSDAQGTTNVAPAIQDAAPKPAG